MIPEQPENRMERFVLDELNEPKLNTSGDRCRKKAYAPHFHTKRIPRVDQVGRRENPSDECTICDGYNYNCLFYEP